MSLGLHVVLSSSSSRRYSPGWALASSTIRLHWSLFLAFCIHPLIPILLRSAITSSSHLILGLPILLVAYSFPFSTLLGMAVSSILSTWPSHCILCAFIYLTISSPAMSLHSSTLYLIRHTPLMHMWFCTKDNTRKWRYNKFCLPRPIITDNSSWTAWPLKMGKVCCPEMSVTVYQPTLRKVPEKRRPQLHTSLNPNDLNSFKNVFG